MCMGLWVGVSMGSASRQLTVIINSEFFEENKAIVYHYRGSWRLQQTADDRCLFVCLLLFVLLCDSALHFEL